MEFIELHECLRQVDDLQTQCNKLNQKVWRTHRLVGFLVLEIEDTDAFMEFEDDKWMITAETTYG